MHVCMYIMHTYINICVNIHAQTMPSLRTRGTTAKKDNGNNRYYPTTGDPASRHLLHWPQKSPLAWLQYHIAQIDSQMNLVAV